MTDSRGCVATSNSIIVPALQPVNATSNKIDVLCSGAATGVITITPSGGTAPYEISTDGGTTWTTQFSYSALAGSVGGTTYDFIVRDDNECPFPIAVQIFEPAALVASYHIDPIQCDGSGLPNNGQICVTGDILGLTNIPISGGVAPYTYTLVDLTGGTPNQVYNTTTNESHCFTNLPYGLYNLIITDANGCTRVLSNIEMISEPSGALIISNSIPGTCLTGASIELQVTPAFGSGTYFFSLFPNSNPPETFPGNGIPNNAGGWFGETGPDTYTFTGLAPGVSYNFIIWDSVTKCYYFHNESTPAATSSLITITRNPINVTCTDATPDGSVQFSFSGYLGTSVSYEIRNAFTNAVVLGPVPLNRFNRGISDYNFSNITTTRKLLCLYYRNRPCATKYFWMFSIIYNIYNITIVIAISS